MMTSEKNNLYRYIPFDRFIQLLFNKKLTLVSPCKWPDQYELCWLKALETEQGKKALLEHSKEFNGDCNNNAEKIKKLNEFIYNNTYCLCFSSEKDSEVLWNAHSDNNRAIMIVTTEEKLRNFTDKYSSTVREVQYDLEQSNIVNDFLEKYTVYTDGTAVFNTFDLFLHKRRCFEYEHEVRLLLSEPGKGEDGLLHLEIGKLSDLIDGVLVHPLADNSYVSLIEMLCEKFEIEFLGKSNIYEFSYLKEGKNETTI